MLKKIKVVSLILCMVIFNYNIIYAVDDPLSNLFNDNNNVQSSSKALSSNENVKAEFKTSIVGGDAQPQQYLGNTNTYLNRMIQCTRFKADMNDPACQQFDYSASFQSFVNKNFNKDKVNEILNSVNINNNKGINTENVQKADVQQGIENSNINTTQNVNENIIAYEVVNSVNNKSIISNKNTNKKSNISVPTGPNTNVIIMLILFCILILYNVWLIYKMKIKSIMNIFQRR